MGLFLTAPTFPEGPEYEAYLSRYWATFQEPPLAIYSATTYDAANLLAHAIETVAVQDMAGSLQIGRQALRDALYTTSGFPGLGGTLTCDQYGDCAVTRFHVMRLDDPAAGLEGLKANVVWTYPPDE